MLKKILLIAKKQWMFLYCYFGIMLGIAACGTQSSPQNQFPTLAPILQIQAPTSTPNPLILPTVPSTTVSGAVPTDMIAGTPNPELSTDEQYRAWMEEARALHPYTDSVDLMWDVMMCESSGRAHVEGPGGLTGLFQYLPTTWQGDWNPYRDQPITDAKAQIFATAKAWSVGLKQWWAPCL